MPPKITTKNLHYDDTLPPFLRRLRANESLNDDRQDFTVARPKKTRTAEEEAEDEPVYFNEESGETLTKREWEERENGPAKEAERVIPDPEMEGGEEEVEKEKVAAIGGSRKRKVGRIVGNEGDVEVDGKLELKSTMKKGGGKVEGKKAVEKGKSVKKAKKVKLSFGDDD